MQHIGRRLDRAVHVSVAGRFALSGRALAMVFVVLWYDAALDDRYGRDIEHLLDAKPA